MNVVRPLLLVCLFHTVGAHPFFQQLSRKACNDAAATALQNGRSLEARSWLSKASTLESEAGETSRTWSLLGDTEDYDGFASKSLTAYRQSLFYARQGNLPGHQATASNGIANELISLGQYDSVLFYLAQARTYDSTGRAGIINNLAAARYRQGQNQNDLALSNFQKAYDAASLQTDHKLMAIALAGIGSTYFNHSSDMGRAVANFQRSIAWCDSLKDFNLLARNYGRLANCYMVLGKLTESRAYLARAIRIVDLSGNLPVRGYVLSSLSILASEEGNPQTSIQYAEESLAIKRALGQLHQLQPDLLNVSENYAGLKEYDKAMRLIREGISISTALNDVVYLGYFYKRASQIDSIKGNYADAYTNLRKSMQFKDSAISLQRIKAVEEMREKYETGQKEKTIAENAVEIQHQKYIQSLILGASATALLLFIVVLITVRNRHKSRLETEKLRQHHLRLQTIVNTQEDVQQSIARDLHDGLVQLLGAAKMALQSVSPASDKETAFGRITDASRIIDEACTEARNISHQILPYSLMKDGLIPALRELFLKGLPHANFTAGENHFRLNPVTEINIYRIAQEMVNNISKHAQATHSDISVIKKPNSVTLLVVDDGVGFNLETITPGAGLTNIRTRATLLGATLDISSGKNTGTRINLIVPL